MTVLANFIGVGPKKCGTTWLYDHLAQHPNIFFPDTKEVRFFDLNWDLGEKHYGSLYAPGRRYEARGDITPTYLHRRVGPRIRELIPDAKILITLRHPVERTVSHFAHRYRTEKSFPDPDEFFADRTNWEDTIVKWSLYADGLEHLFDHIPFEQSLAIRFESIREQPTTLLDEVAAFLTLPSHDWQLLDNSNPPIQFRSAVYATVHEIVAKTLHRNGLDVVRRVIKRTGLPKVLSRANAVRVTKPKISRETFERLTEHFEPDIRRVEELLGWDLANWRRPGTATRS